MRITSPHGTVTVVADAPPVAMLARLKRRRHPSFPATVTLGQTKFETLHECYCRAEAEDILAGRPAGYKYANDRKLTEPHADMPGAVICMTTGQCFRSISEAARVLGLDRGLIKRAVHAPDGFAPSVNLHFFQVKRPLHGPFRS